MEYKYRLHYLLRRLPVEDYENAMKNLPKVLGISSATLKVWIYLKEDSHFDIPFCKLVYIANFLEVEPMQLYNDSVQKQIKKNISKQLELRRKCVEQ